MLPPLPGFAWRNGTMIKAGRITSAVKDAVVHTNRACSATL
jgi:hypothetical protein